MEELFTNIPKQTKELTRYWVNMALNQKDYLKALNMILNFKDSCFTVEEKEFVDFYLQMKMEQLINENNND